MERYSNINFEQTYVIDDDKNVKYYNTLLDCDIPTSTSDIYVITTIGDRLDLLSYEYYKTPYYWWIIANANPHIIPDSMNLEPGIQLRIPSDIQDIIDSFEDTNSLRRYQY